MTTPARTLSNELRGRPAARAELNLLANSCRHRRPPEVSNKSVGGIEKLSGLLRFCGKM